MPSRLAPPRSRNCYVWLGLLAGLLIVPLIYFHWHNALTRAQQAYLWSYAWNSLKVAAWPKADAFLANWYRVNVFHDPAADFIAWPLLASVFTVFVCVMAGAVADEYRIRSWRAGKWLRGPWLASPRRFNRIVKGDGFAFHLNAGSLAFFQPRRIAISYRQEVQHAIFMGVNGSGKTTSFMQRLDVAEKRGEAAFIFDPHQQFVQRYFNAERGDIVLNPLDDRCPNWSIVEELDLSNQAVADANMRALAMSMYPPTREPFWSNGSQRLLSYLVTRYQPETTAELGRWMQYFDPEIDRRIWGNDEMEKLVSEAAPNQRTGMISHFTEPSWALRNIPEDRETWSIRRYLDNPRAWVFLTSTAETRKALQPLHSIWLDTLIMRRISMGERTDVPRLVVGIDEVETLNPLPSLVGLMREGRKAEMSVLLGVHGRKEMIDLYGEKSEALFSEPVLKLLLRVSEPDAQDWASRMIGEAEKEYLRESTSVSGGASHRHRSYSTETKTERLVLASEFSSLDDLTGYLHYGKVIAKIKLAFVPRRELKPAFVPRYFPPVKKLLPMTVEEYREERKKKKKLEILENLPPSNENPKPATPTRRRSSRNGSGTLLITVPRVIPPRDADAQQT